MTSKTRLRLTVTGLFLEQEEVLLIHQMTFPEPDRWDLPGGGIDPEETVLEALKREVKEETGIEEFKVESLLTVIDAFFPEGEGKVLHSVNIVYLCSVSPKPVNLSSKDPEIGPKGIQWLPIKSLTPEICSRRGWEALKAAGKVNVNP
jgi:ADP-ribose pyrophosphatase YjhB (NUDIX family)